MRKKILTALMCIMLCGILGISAFATGDIGIIGGVDGETQIIVDDDAFYGDDFGLDEDYFDFSDAYSYYSYADDEEFMAQVESDPILAIFSDDPEMLQYFYDLGVDNFKFVVLCSTIAVIFGIIFIPALVLLIVFAVLNSKTKKSIKELEMKAAFAQSYGYMQGGTGYGYQPQQVAPQPVPQPINTQPIPQPVNTQPQQDVTSQADNVPQSQQSQGGEEK